MRNLLQLWQVGGLLDSKGYGIATSKGTPYKEYLDHAILKLMEGGVLHKLKIKWWKQKRGGGACQASGGGGGVSPLGLSSVAGVFLVTLAGCGIAVIFAIIEFLYGTKLSSSEAGVRLELKLFITHTVDIIHYRLSNVTFVSKKIKTNLHSYVPLVGQMR